MEVALAVPPERAFHGVTWRVRDDENFGYFDSLHLPLVEGDNELVVAVSEDLGGWGVQARFADLFDLAFSTS